MNAVVVSAELEVIVARVGAVVKAKSHISTASRGLFTAAIYLVLGLCRPCLISIIDTVVELGETKAE